MPENQNPVFCDESLAGDGTAENPLGVEGGPVNPGGSAGDVQLNDGAGKFTSANLFSSGAAQVSVDASGNILIQTTQNLTLLISPGGELSINGPNTAINNDFSAFSNSTFIGNNNGGLTTISSLTVLMDALQTFANNAAAVTGGLQVNQLYRDGADPEHVCIVH
jgi:hypothetical protein